MGPGRPRTAIGTFGDFTYVTAPNGKVKARGDVWAAQGDAAVVVVGMCQAAEPEPMLVEAVNA